MDFAAGKRGVRVTDMVRFVDEGTWPSIEIPIASLTIELGALAGLECGSQESMFSNHYRLPN